MALDSQAIVQAGIEHINAIGEYSVIWDSKDPKAILAAWEKVQRTRAIVVALEKEDTDD
jgi:hypothetical protein